MMKKDTFCEYILKYQTDLFRYAKSMVGNQADGEDAVSETILKAYENIDQLRSQRKFKSWIFKILTNECYSILRKRTRIGLTETGEVPETAYYDMIEEGDILKLIQQMKPEYRNVLILYYYNDFSVREIANILEIPVGTVKSRLSRGRKQLRSFWKKEGYQYEL